ncbi:GspE/PulE family protein [Oleisolibacter albus]|uniref:GspE/PulE family protein n=1 Tax=Oleisolibacter albus TaxID=2171757 RepID=UPI001EFCC6E5|nr:ATPase, T2SS/T4P/T4SS family [Oleisolibacter albus]
MTDPRTLPRPALDSAPDPTLDSGPAAHAAVAPLPAGGDLDRILLERALVSPDGLARARLVRDQTGDRLDAVLTRLGLVSEQALAEALAAACGLPLMRPGDWPQAAHGTDRAGPRFLRRVRALPLGQPGAVLELAVADPTDPYPARALSFAFGRPVALRVARLGDLDAAIDRLYGGEAGPAPADDASADDADLERLRDLSSDAPVVRAVNALIARAAEARASDIHIEPTEDRLRVRLRVDGALREIEGFPAGLRGPLVSRIKVMAGLDVAERRLPQDGRLRLAVRGHDIDFRVATAPTIHGESVVLRILDRSGLALELETLGFGPDLLPLYRGILDRPHGITLVTGPTGSGKTTTLYASLAVLNTPDRKILTVEDPVEYRLEGVNQIQVKQQIGLDFAATLRSFLRQDPDVIMVGEIRDLETAQVAVQAALTGHAILSTLHTNDAASAFTRLLDMGVEPFLIASTVNAALAQRLVRRLCPHCRQPAPAGWVPPLPPGLTQPAGARFWQPAGCPACHGEGFRGRLAVLELLPMDEAVARLVLARAEARDIRRAAQQAGMRAMLADGLAKAMAGETTLEEVLRVTQDA